MSNRSVLQIAQSASLALGIDEPSSLFGVSERTEKELARVASQMALRISREHDWQALKRQATITGDGSTEAFDLPTDYDRQPKDGQIWSREYFASLPSMPSTNDLQNVQTRSFAFVRPAWTMLGDQINFYPALGQGESVQFYYVSEHFAKADSGTAKDEFTDDGDTFALDDLTLELGMIWQWRQSKGLPYAEDMQNYELALAKEISRDKGPRILTQRSSGRIDATTAYPGVITP